MKVEQFNYNLPKELIAQYPRESRGTTNLMVLDRKARQIEHRKYSDIAEYLKKGDVVVLNKTKVINARLHGVVNRNHRKVECLFLKPRQELNAWEGMIGFTQNIKIGDTIKVDENVSISVFDREKGAPNFLVRIEGIPSDELFSKYGEVPLPAYINREVNEDDEIRYNTVFSELKGSVAAPTASLNLTEKMLNDFEAKGIKVVYIDLTVGWGTFAPIRVDNIEDHNIHSEKYSISEESAEAINSAIRSGGKVCAFGTTVSRVLETVGSTADDGTKSVAASTGETSIYIYPGYDFKIVDILVTNFHSPLSSLIMLVSAFAGHEFTMEAYRVAVEEKYAFLSYGDSMLIK